VLEYNEKLGNCQSLFRLANQRPLMIGHQFVDTCEAVAGRSLATGWKRSAIHAARIEEILPRPNVILRPGPDAITDGSVNGSGVFVH